MGIVGQPRTLVREYPETSGERVLKKNVLSFVHEFSVELVEKLQCRKVFPVQSLISSYKSQINQERAKEEPKLEAGKEVGGPTGPGCAPHCELLVKTLAACNLGSWAALSRAANRSSHGEALRFLTWIFR